MSLTRFGDVTTSGQDTLLCDLSSPIHAGTLVSFQIIDRPAFSRVGARRQWRWTVTGGSSPITEIKSDPKPFRFVVPSAGSVTVRGELLVDEIVVIDISKTLAVTSTGAVQTSWNSGSNLSKAITEITTDLSDYITSGANSTGANGISPRFLASVLLIEVTNRPKSDRFSELDSVGEDVSELMLERQGNGLFRHFNLNIHLHRSIGVGQTKMSTLAMALGWMPLIEHNRIGASSSAESQIETAFERLTTDQMFELWRRLAWSKSAVKSVAQVLAHLKNRANRFPSMTRAAFGADTRAMQIIASEYNLGATNSPEAAAGPTGYGQIVESVCTGQGGTSYRSASVPFRMFSHP